MKYLRLQKSISLIFVVLFFAKTGLAQVNTPSGATRPFGSNSSYEYGLMPSNLPIGGAFGSASEIKTIYDDWKEDYVENCGDNMARVKFDNPYQTVSEGVAYSMLLAAYAADQDLFNRLWAFYKHHRNHNGVMHWKIDGCNNVSGENGATDAELDAAMALIVANHQWPNTTSPHNYKTDAVALINAIKNHEINKSDFTFENGDMWKPNCRNPSYQAPGYARIFKIFMAENGHADNTFWDKVVTATEQLLVNNAHSTSGLATNWATPSGPPSPGCSGSGTQWDKFGYDACRAPWRQATNYIWFGAAASSMQTIVNRQVDFWISQGGAGEVSGGDHRNHDGSGYGDHNGAFVGMVGALSLAASNTPAHQNFCNAIYTRNKTVSSPAYFSKILQMLGLFVQTGNFWNPYAASSGGGNNQLPTVSLTAPANNTTVCAGTSVTLTATASDPDGSISKVEFYHGTTLITTRTSAPYTYNWTNAPAGTLSITAKAYDNTNASATSAARTLVVNAIPNAPAVAETVNYCVGSTASRLTATGTGLKWYTAATGGSGNSTAPTPSTSSAGTQNYWVSQTVNGCESARARITVTVGAAASAPQVVPTLSYCQGENAPLLTATGTGLRWYTAATGGTGSTTAPRPNTANTGTQNFWVSQTVSGCESPRANIQVTIKAAPVAPVVTSPVLYELNAPATPLIATGIGLKWYAAAAGGTASASAPTPSTSSVGTTNYYVSQTVNGCESPRAVIAVSVSNNLPVYKTSVPVVVDGQIDEIWNDVSSRDIETEIRPSVSGPADLSGWFKTLWDEQYFYILAVVTDDVKVNDSQDVYEDDGIELFFDIGNNKATTYGARDVQYTFRWNDTQIHRNPSGRSVAGISFVMTGTATGYVFEARVPWSTLQGSPLVGQLHGFDIHINDDDNGGTRDGKLSWASPNDDAWQNPSLLGTMVLFDEDRITGISGSLIGSALECYPNPFNTYVQVEGLTGEVNYSFVDLSGRIVKTGRTSGYINTDMEPGAYNLILHLETGNKFVKLVKIR